MVPRLWRRPFERGLACLHDQCSKTASSVLSLTAALPLPRIVPVARFAGPDCQLDFHSHALLVSHCLDKHSMVDAAKACWKRNRGECPFCLCFCREGTEHNGSQLHFTATPSGNAWRCCHDAYVAWSARGGPLPVGTVTPSLQLARHSLLSGAVDQEADDILRDRVARRSSAAKTRQTHSATPAVSEHSISTSRLSGWCRARGQGRELERRWG